MPNCSVCGTPMTDSGVCPNCGGQTAAQAPNSAYAQGSVPPPPGYPPQQPYQGQGYAPPPPQQGYPPQQGGYPPPGQGYPPQQGGYPPQQGGYPPSYGYAQAPVSPIIADSLASIKQLFSSNPQTAVDTAVNSRAHVWVVLGLLNVIFTGLACMLIPLGSGIDVALGTFLLAGLLASAVSLFVFPACLKGVCAFHKKNISYVQLLNLLSSSLLISTVSLIAAIIFGFIWSPIAILFISFGSLGSILMLYMGLNKVILFEKNPLWAFLIANVVNSIAVYLCAFLVLLSAILRLAGSFGSYFF